jgi:hypothetical protein
LYVIRVAARFFSGIPHPHLLGVRARITLNPEAFALANDGCLLACKLVLRNDGSLMSPKLDINHLVKKSATANKQIKSRFSSAAKDVLASRWALLTKLRFEFRLV